MLSHLSIRTDAQHFILVYAGYQNCIVLAGMLNCDMQDPEEWPLIAPLPSYGRGRERLGPRHISLIHGEGLNDVVVTGTMTYVYFISRLANKSKFA